MLRSRGFYKGINLGGWLSQCDYSEERLDNFITEPDFARIASFGVDHVRIPIDYNVVENDDGTYKAEGFARIDKALALCEKYGLKTVLDLHKTAGFSFDAGEKESGFFENERYQERFFRLWEEFARRYGGYADRVVFELLNEVTEERYIGTWNRISHECIRRIRVYAPDTLILVGSWDHNSAHTVKDLAAPYDDKVVYNFHCYEPLSFTHQGATWTLLIDPKVRVSYDDSRIAPDFFENFFASAVETARRNHTSLYCGEYGVIDQAAPEDTVKWYRHIHAALEKFGIARSMWSYKQMDFGLTDARLDGVRDELLKYL